MIKIPSGFFRFTRIGLASVLINLTILSGIDAQPMLYFRNLDVSDGLSSNMINSLGQDSHGFVWIGTRDGLMKFDGLTTEKFYHDPEDSTSIASNSIAWSIKEDPKGRIWITLHGGGFTFYDPLTGHFNNYTFANGKLPADWSNHTQEVVFHQGKTYVFSNQGLTVLDSLDRVSSTTFLPAEPGLADMGHIRMAAKQGTSIWLATLMGLARYDLTDDTWHYHHTDKAKNSVFRGTWGIHGAAYINGTIWFSTYFKPKETEHRFLYSYDIDSELLDSIAIPFDNYRKDAFSDQIHDIEIGNDGDIWLATNGLGLVRFNPKTRVWNRYNGTDEWSGALLPGPIRSLLSDKDNNLWIGLRSGLSIMSPHRQYFQNYAVVNDDNGKRIELSQIRKMNIGPDGEIWLGKLGQGLIKLDSNKRYVGSVKTLYPSNSDYNDYIEPEFADSTGLYANVWYDGIARLQPDGSVVRSGEFTEDDSQELRNVFRSSSGKMYGFGWGIIGLIDWERENFTYRTMPLNSSGKPDIVWNVVEDDEGNIWLGMGQHGLICIDPNTLETLNQWRLDTAKYAKTTVWKLIHHDGRIFFAMNDLGMGILSANGEITSYSRKDGLCSDELNGFVKDKSGHIWTYSYSGLSWFDEDNGRFKTFNEADGMVSEKVNDAELLSNGNILLITEAGLVEFDPEALKLAGGLKTPLLRTLKVFDTDINVTSWAKHPFTVNVPHDKNYLRAEFSAMEFIDPEKVKFAYRLDGVEQEWNYTDHRPRAIYTNLKGGNYQLCAKCADRNGEWGEELCIPVFVTTPFYKKAYFIILVILLAGILSYLGYRWQLKRKLAVLEVRNRLSKDLHDDIGSALSSINIYSTVAQQQIDQNKEETRKLLKRMGSSAQVMMQSMDDIIWTIDPKNDDVGRLVVRMREFALPILEAKNIQLRMDVNKSIENLKLDMVTRRNLFLIFKEAVNNLAKYSQATEACIVMDFESNWLSLKIHDNGQGFDVSAPTERHGLANMESRTKDLNGHFNLQSSLGKGTQLYVKIPV